MIDQLPYHASLWEIEHVLGHGTRDRKLYNADRIIEGSDFDDTYKQIVKVHKQNMLLEKMLDNDEDQDRDEVKPPVRKRAAPKKKAPAKRVALSKLIETAPNTVSPAESAPTP